MEKPATAASPAKTVMLVDDHPTFREGLRSLIGHIGGFTVCAEVDGESTAMHQLHTFCPDLMIVDLNLQDGSGLKLIHRALQDHPDLNILVASMYEEALYGERAINAGALGYVCKQDDPELLTQAITTVSRGERFVSNKLANSMRDHELSGNSAGASEPTEILSDRELQIFGLIGSGLSTKEIASQLNLSSKTIDTHRDHIKKKLGITDNVRLVHRAIEWVLLQ